MNTTFHFLTLLTRRFYFLLLFLCPKIMSVFCQSLGHVLHFTTQRQVRHVNRIWVIVKWRSMSISTLKMRVFNKNSLCTLTLHAVYHAWFWASSIRTPVSRIHIHIFMFDCPVKGQKSLNWISNRFFVPLFLLFQTHQLYLSALWVKIRTHVICEHMIRLKPWMNPLIPIVLVPELPPII